MVHLPLLIQDLALILVAAGVVTLLFRRIRQPMVLGYILAGFLVGPHVNWIPNIADLNGVQIWAEIGVIFLLFALGLEFSFKKLVKVGGSASITAFVEVAGMTTLGYLIGKVFGWSNMDSLFLGGALAISSTTIIIRAFEEAKVKGRGFADLVFGVLVVEDLFAILLLVLLSTVAVSNQFDGMALMTSVFKLGFFLTIWFLLGIFFLPTWMRKIKKYSDSETTLVVSLGFCFLMVVLSTKAGFSPALGAFIMGSLFAETSEVENIEHLVKPVKDLFAAIFFVSVGMLINPQVIMEYIGPILAITLLTIVGKFIFSASGALLAGRSLRHSVQAGMSLAQIGEFSFIIAALGLSLKVTSDFLYPITVGVSALTTFSTPYMIKYADLFYELIEKYLPQKYKDALSRYSAPRAQVVKNSDWEKVLRSALITIATNSVLIVAVFFGMERILPNFLSQYTTSQEWKMGFTLMLATLASSPFFWALFAGHFKKEELHRLWNTKEFKRSIVLLNIVRAGVGTILFLSLSAHLIGIEKAAVITIIFLTLFLTFFSRYLKHVYGRIEGRFMENLSHRNPEEPVLAPWDAHISRLLVSQNSDAIGKSLEELKIRETYGVILALIERGHKIITAPPKDEKLFPGDIVSAIGSDEQILNFKEFVCPQVDEYSSAPNNYILSSVLINDSMPFCNKPIRTSGIREKTNGLVVGIERKGQRILNPDSNIIIELNDVLWIVGNSEKIRAL